MRVLGLACASLVLVGCVSDSPVAPVGTGNDAGAPDVVTQQDTGVPDASALATLTLAPGAPFILRQGQSVDVTVTFNRNGLTGPIALTATGAQAGTNITVAPIGDGTLTTQMKITTSASAAVGSVPITLKAPNVADLTFTLVVEGPTATLDTSFDTDGIVLDTSVSAGSFNAVLAQSDGKIIVAGNAASPSGAWLVRRYDVDGSPDTVFNANIAPDLPATGMARAIALDPKSGRIVVVGNVGAGTTQFAILRLNASGKADQSFATSGLFVATTVEFGYGSQANAVGVRSDSSILVAVQTGVPHGLLFRYLENGTRDSGFGFATGTGNSSGSLSSIAILPQDLTFATGTSSLANPSAPLAVRLLADSSPDLNFAAAGQKKLSPDADYCTGRSAAYLPSGDVLILGNDNTSPSCEVRISAAGAFKWKLSTDGNLQGEAGGATAAPADGTYTVGWFGGTYDKTGYVRRRLATGALDTTWGGTGQIVFEDTTPTLPDAFYFAFKAVTTLSDGRVVVVGQRRLSSSPGPVIYRLWP